MANVAPDPGGVAPMESHAGSAENLTETMNPTLPSHPGLLQEFSAKGVLFGCGLLAAIVAIRWGTFAQTVLLLWVGYAVPYVASSLLLEKSARKMVHDCLELGPTSCLGAKSE